MKITHFSLLCCLGLTLAFYTTQLWAKAPRNAKIAFTSNRDGNWDIYIMNADGSQQVNLTEHAAADFNPTWSPSGEQILFNSNRGGEPDLYLMDVDGKNVRKVLAKSAERLHPTWSPDGKQIAYLRVDEWAIYIVTVDGKVVEKVADTGQDGGNPAWSPDGSEIVFTLAGRAKLFDLFWPGSRQLHIINLHTGTARTLFAEQKPIMENPAWSPDAKWLAFSWTNRDLWEQDVWDKWGKRVLDVETIYVASRHGDEFRQVVSEEGPRAREPAWSPLGDELLFSQKTENQYQIFKIHVDGGTPVQLTEQGNNYSADWFDPETLPVMPQPDMLTKIWGELKQRN